MEIDISVLNEVLGKTSKEVSDLMHTKDHVATTSTFESTKWLQDNIEQYPLLKSSSGHKYHWSKFKSNLDSLFLHGDSILELERFWNTVDNAYMTTLCSNVGLSKYDQLTISYDIKSKLPAGDTSVPQYRQCAKAYENFSYILKEVLINPIVIKQTTSPKAYSILQANRLLVDGFQILQKIVFILSPQLGGKGPDPQKLVHTINYMTRDSLSDFHLRVMEVYNSIKLQDDQTGQTNRLVGKYVELLYGKNEDFRLVLYGYYIEWTRMKKDHLNIHKKKLSFDLTDVYDTLVSLDLNLPVSSNETSVPTATFVESNIEGIDNNTPDITSSVTNIVRNSKTQYPGRQTIGL